MYNMNLGITLGKLLLEHRQIITSAESCTGGNIAVTITDVAGSSSWFERAFITYSNQSKIEMLGVNLETLEYFGAVSEAVANEMVTGALQYSKATIGVSVSGVAGPSGINSDMNTVGTVCFAWADNTGWKKTRTKWFPGDRYEVRHHATNFALQEICNYLQNTR